MGEMEEKGKIVPPSAGAARVLHLTLIRHWFDEIAAGRKPEEYRLCTPYWIKRLEGREYDEIHFRNGYAKAAPWMRVEWRGCRLGLGGITLPSPYRDAWIFAIGLGRILELRNYEASTARSAPASSRGSIPESPSEAGTLPDSTPTPHGGNNG